MWKTAASHFIVRLRHEAHQQTHLGSDFPRHQPQQERIVDGAQGIGVAQGHFELTGIEFAVHRLDRQADFV